MLSDTLRMCAEMQPHILLQCTCLYNSCTGYEEQYKLRQRNLQLKKINSLLRYSSLNHLALERSQRRSPMPRDTPLGPHAPLEVLNSSYCHHRGGSSVMTVYCQVIGVVQRSSQDNLHLDCHTCVLHDQLKQPCNDSNSAHKSADQL